MAPRRVSLPGAAELFRSTTQDSEHAVGPVRHARVGRRDTRTSGRERHDEKITVYVSAEELLDLEHARLALRSGYGLSVDRGRIVREAVAAVVSDLDARGEASILVRRLHDRG